MEPRVMIMAGGTGGHVFPALAVAERLRALGMQVTWLGTRSGFEAELVPARGYAMEWVRVRGLRGKGLQRWVLAPLVIARAMVDALAAIRRIRPRVVLGMGGFVSGPGGLAARLLRIPLVIHEQNRVPGMTNQWLSRVATRVFEAFPGSFPAGRGAIACGNPVRAEIFALPAPAQRLGDRAGSPRLLVLGGSQGARALNRLVPEALALLPGHLRPEVWHQTGRGRGEETAIAYREGGVEAHTGEFVDDMAEAYAWADLAICRAGALTVSELAAAGLGAILVPYPFAVDDHQTGNAAFLVDVGAAILLRESDLTAPLLAEHLGALLQDRTRLLAMAEAGRALAQPEAATILARACLEVSV